MTQLYDSERELDSNGRPLRASTFDWAEKGYDGFLGYGEEPDGGCCEDCICDDLCYSTLIVWYEWQAPCKDLDTNTTYLNDSVGFDCLRATQRSIKWSSDDTGVGGREYALILFDESEIPTSAGDYLEVDLHAGWYQYAWDNTCNGNFEVYVLDELKDPSLGDGQHILLQKSFNTLVQQSSCASNYLNTIQFNNQEIKWKN